MRRKKDRIGRIDFHIFPQQYLYVQPAERIAMPELDLWHMKDITPCAQSLSSIKMDNANAMLHEKMRGNNSCMAHNVITSSS